jgi:hypothetical protein
VKAKLKSRKLWAFIGSVVLGLVYPPSIPILKLLAPVYIGGQAAVDAAEKWRG